MKTTDQCSSRLNQRQRVKSLPHYPTSTRSSGFCWRKWVAQPSMLMASTILACFGASLAALAATHASDGEVEDYPVMIAQTSTSPPNQTIDATPSPTSCSVQGGTLSGVNLFTPFDNGTMGFENGDPDQSPLTNPYLDGNGDPIITGGDYFQYNSPASNPAFRHPTYGEYSFVANMQNARNDYQHEGIIDPVYGLEGRFFVSDPNNDTPEISVTLMGLTPNQFYEYSFWAANAEPSTNGNNNNIDVIIGSQTIYSTGPLPEVSSALAWKKHTVAFTNGPDPDVTIVLKSTETGNEGNDFNLDNIELRECNFAEDYGDAPISYGEALHTTIPTTPTVFLGAAPDSETTTLLGGDNGAGADGDTDEAFTTLPDVPLTGAYDLTSIPVTNTSGGNAILHGWVDFNQNGTFEVNEYTSTTVANGVTIADLNWTVPPGTSIGNTIARFRISPNALIPDDVATLTVDERSKDAVINGEVEDYPVAIASTIPDFCSLGAQFDNPLSLDFSTLPTIESGVDQQPGTVYRFSDVASGIDALVTLQDIDADSIIWLLSNSGNGSLGASIRDVSSGFFEFKIDLVTADSSTQISPVDLAITSFDIDGTSGNTVTDFAEFFNPDITFVNDPTQLEPTINGTDVKFTNTNTGFNDQSSSLEYAAGAIYLDTSTVLIRGGMENSTKAASRTVTFSLDLTRLSLFDAEDCTTLTTSSNPNMVLVKRITAINGEVINPNDGTTLLDEVVDDTTSTYAADDNNAGWPADYLIGAMNAGLVKPGDEIEYTVYFLSSGDADAREVRICDRIQPGQAFQLGTDPSRSAAQQLRLGTADIQFQQGNSSILDLTAAYDAGPTGDRAQLVAAGTTPSNCNLSAANDNDTLVIDITGAVNTGSPTVTELPNSTGSGTPNDSYGFFRFVTKVDE